MSKERLEELAYNVGISHTGEYARMKADDYVFLYEYALEQAERVQELEEANKKNYWIASDFKYENLVLEQQNKRYKELIDTIIYRLVTGDAYDESTVINAIQIDIDEFMEDEK